jgi:hypothetical protein
MTKPAKRSYHQHGAGVVSKAWPYLLERVKDQLIRDDELSPIERAARSWRVEVLDDLGGQEAVPATKRAVLDAALGSKILLDSLDRYLFALAVEDGLVNHRNEANHRSVPKVSGHRVLHHRRRLDVELTL